MNKHKTSQSAFIVPTVVFIMLIISVSSLALATFAVNHFARINRNLIATNALLTAEAGGEQTLNQLNQDNDFAGYASEQEFFNNQVQGRSTYQTEVTQGSVSNEKLITATGRVYRDANDATPIVIRKIRLTVVGTTAPGNAIQTGPGGLIMSNSATIANGNVYVNGTIAMSNSARIGSPINPVNVWVAHESCPTNGGPTYPSQCTSGQPITISNAARIYGSVCATNQTNGAGMSNPGLQAGCSAQATELPDYDRQAQINAVATTITSQAASCQGLQSKTWEANTHITGNAELSNICIVTIKGNVWIDGRLRLNNISVLRVDNSVTSMPTIMVDGSDISLSNASIVLPNASGIGIQFITYRSAAACSPNCADVTGSDLFNSKDIRTITISNASLAAGSILYARWSKVELSNSGSVGALAGQTVQLNNAGNISFGTQLSSGNSIWSIKNYRQIFD